MSVKESLTIFGVPEEKAESILKSIDDEFAFDSWLCNTPILHVISEMATLGWL